MNPTSFLRHLGLLTLTCTLFAQTAAPSATPAQPAAPATVVSAPAANPNPSGITPEEARKLQSTINKAAASPEAKAAEENLKRAREELAKASQAYQASVEKAAVELEPSVAPVLEKTHKIQQDAQTRRSQAKPGSPTTTSGAVRAPVRPTNQPMNAQPAAYAPVRRAPMQAQATVPRPSDLLDNWVAVGIIFGLGIATVFFLRRKA